MGAWVRFYGTVLVLQHVGAILPQISHADPAMQAAFCPDHIANVEVHVTTHLAVNPVFVSTFCPGNTVINITGGVTIFVDNAPTTISTQVCASTTVVKTVTITRTTSDSVEPSSSVSTTASTTPTVSTLSTVKVSSISVSTTSTTPTVSMLSTMQGSSSSLSPTADPAQPRRPITIGSAVSSCGDNAQLSCCNTADTSGDSANIAFGILSGLVPNLLSGQQGLGLFNGCSKLSVTGLIGLDNLIDSQCKQTATCCQDTSQSQNGLINLGVPCIALGSLL